jgi:hypothetical protein
MVLDPDPDTHPHSRYGFGSEPRTDKSMRILTHNIDFQDEDCKTVEEEVCSQPEEDCQVYSSYIFLRAAIIYIVQQQ